MNREQLAKLIRVVEQRSTNLESYCHGPQHWRCVSLVGIQLARQTKGGDALVAFLFGLLHDAMRVNDNLDPEHGPRAAVLCVELQGEGLLPLCAPRRKALVYACETHTSADPTREPLQGVCYDADRLNLWRVNIIPEAKYLSTKAGKERARTHATVFLHETPLEWSDVLDELFFEDEDTLVKVPNTVL